MKGQIQFNWIFVLVAGVLLLSFIVGFGYRYGVLQERKTSFEILEILDDTFSSLQASSFQTVDEIDLVKPVNVECELLKIGNENKKTRNLLFSPSVLEGNTIVWYQPYKLPFIVTQLYYLVSEDNKFYLVYDDDTEDFVDELIEGLPVSYQEHVSKIPYGIDRIDGKLVYFGPGSKGVHVEGNINEGVININGESYAYVGKEMIYGAVFSDNYDCLHDKVISELDGIIDVYKNKINHLQGSRCDYRFIASKLEELRTPSLDVVNQLESLNRNLVGLNCAPVF